MRMGMSEDAPRQKKAIDAGAVGCKGGIGDTHIEVRARAHPPTHMNIHRAYAHLAIKGHSMQRGRGLSGCYAPGRSRIALATRCSSALKASAASGLTPSA